MIRTGNGPGKVRYYKSMSALPIILKQNSVSVGLFTLLRERELGKPRLAQWSVGIAEAPLSLTGGWSGARNYRLDSVHGECVKLFGEALKPPSTKARTERDES
jgi:hypothetical protein